GTLGSYFPSVLNIIQLVGWATLEIVVMATAVDGVVKAVFNYSNLYLWVIIFAFLCTAMGIAGPLTVIKQWLEKFAVWVLYGSTVWIAYWALTTRSFWELAAAPAQGGLPFLLAVDITIAMPMSWMPLIADYNRFARTSKEGFWGTYIGYIIANIAGYGVGAILILAMGTADVISAIMLLYMGVPAILLILTYEVDNGWADIYSSAVSIQNLLPKLSQRKLIILMGTISAILAMFIPIAEYEWFLLWIGSVFCPLFGVIFVDYFLLKRRKYDVREIYKTKGAYWFWKGINVRAVIAWAMGVLIYYCVVYLIPWLGASVPSLTATAFLYWILTKIRRVTSRTKGEDS
ncbi:MAG: cytosine permease, partial [Candidatus Bathyarchaeia archaeon]